MLKETQTTINNTIMMLKETQTNIVITTELYLISMVEVDILKDELNLVNVEGHISMDSRTAYMIGQKGFLNEQIEKKKNIVKQIRKRI